MKIVFYLFFIIVINTPVLSQYESGKSFSDDSSTIVRDFNDWSYKLASTITSRELKEHIFTLASDQYEGRETGSEGNTMAANYIADQFEHLGLPQVGDEGYFQKLAFTFTSWQETRLSINDVDYSMLKDYISFPQYSMDSDIDTDEIVFMGYGIDDNKYSDYTNQDVRGKVVIVFDGEPINQEGISNVSGTSSTTMWSEDWKLKSKTAKENGATLLIIISNNLQEVIGKNRRQIVNRMIQLGDHSNYISDGANTIFLSPKIAEEIFGSQKEHIIASRNALREGVRETEQIKIDTKLQASFKIKRDVLLGQNVLGYIEGSDKKEEVVVISAHYDHIGTRGDEVYNGADDDASGTTTVLEIAEALTVAKRMGHGPRRSVLCLLVTGEEKGLLGSDYYSQNPVFPLENTIVDVNIDMVGRRGTEYEDNDIPYVYVIGSDRLSADLHRINEDVNNKYSHLLLDYKYNDKDDPNRFYFRSDHYNFAKNGIPAIFFFNGVHEDYHRLTDTPDKIDIELMKHRGKHIFHTVWELANRKERIRVNANGESSL